ncbi:MAG: T9SS type A sorting domain-containing protein [Chitinophagaceae bacterium]
MKSQLLFIALIASCFYATISSAQNTTDAKPLSRNYADVLINSFDVINPQNAVDPDTTNYAVMRTSIGILNYSTLKLGWSNPGSPGEAAVVEFENDGGLLTLDVLESISVTLYDNADNVVAKKNGFDFTQVSAGDAPSHYKLRLPTKDNISNIASIRIRISGLATLENRIRIFYAYLISPCPAIIGDILHAQHNVANAQNAISPDRNDFATLTPPLLLDDSYLDIAFSQPGKAGKKVGFYLGEGNAPLNLDLLRNISLKVYDTNDNLVVSKSGFTLADVEILSNGRFNINIQTPKGNYQIGRGRITFTSLANVLTTLKVYRIVTHVSCSSASSSEEITDLAIPKPQSAIDAKLYPNPFNTYTTLNIKTDVKTTSYIIISDKTGHLVQQEKVSGSGSIKLLEKASPGIYFIKITSGSFTQTQTVMKLN